MKPKFFLYIIVFKKDKRQHYQVKLPIEKLAELVNNSFIARINTSYRGRQDITKGLVTPCETFNTYIKFI